MIIARYGEANEDNELCFQTDIEAVISQVEIYNQVWYVRNLKANGASKIIQQTIDVVREIIIRLEEIPDGCAEIFPFEMIDQLREEYL
ncbi:MAG: hypothetical protein R3Y24_08070 [Eubacteriales bacterium]